MSYKECKKVVKYLLNDQNVTKSASRLVNLEKNSAEYTVETNKLNVAVAKYTQPNQRVNVICMDGTYAYSNYDVILQEDHGARPEVMVAILYNYGVIPAVQKNRSKKQKTLQKMFTKGYGVDIRLGSEKVEETYVAKAYLSKGVNSGGNFVLRVTQ